MARGLQMDNGDGQKSSLAQNGQRTTSLDEEAALLNPGSGPAPCLR